MNDPLESNSQNISLLSVSVLSLTLPPLWSIDLIRLSALTDDPVAAGDIFLGSRRFKFKCNQDWKQPPLNQSHLSEGTLAVIWKFEKEAGEEK